LVNAYGAMDRRDTIESIIIGSLLNDFDGEYFHACKSVIIPEMFRNKNYGKWYHMISDMHHDGYEDTTPLDIMQFNGWKTINDEVTDMMNVAWEYDFLTRKTLYNESIKLNKKLVHKPLTTVTFDAYVNRFIQLVYGQPKQ
jgi:replicative DNA helicase